MVTNITNSLIQQLGCRYHNQTATFFCWAPNIKNLELVLLMPRQKNTYHKKYYKLNKIHDEFYGITLKKINPYQGLNQGMLYYFFDKDKNLLLPDIASDFQPFGVNGPSAIIDHQSYQWKSSINKKANRLPISITKLHIGTSSKEGSFLGLLKNIQQGLYQADDSLEFLPINTFPGENGYIFEQHPETLSVKHIDQTKPINWGYDGGAIFISSITETYGTPNEFKKLIDFIKQQNKKVGIDIQINHFGPAGNYTNQFGHFKGKHNLPWGDSVNLANPIIRKYYLSKIKQFVENYHIDFIRLDMTSGYKDDNFIKEIASQKYYGQKKSVPIIVEDERQNYQWLYKNNVTAQWSIDVVWASQKIINNDFSQISWLLKKLYAQGNNKVVFPSSHDEQGNNSGLPNKNIISYLLTTLSPGIPMFWDTDTYFHFFTNLPNHITLVWVTAEKCFFFNFLQKTDWIYLSPLHKYFDSFEICKKYFQNLHKKWQKEKNTKLEFNWLKTQEHIQHWINKTPNLLEITKAYNLAIYKLCQEKNKDKSFFAQIQFLKKFRQENPWLWGKFTKPNHFKLSKHNGYLYLIRQNGTQTICLVLKFNKPGLVKLNLPKENMRVIFSNCQRNNHVFKTKKLSLLIHPQEYLLLIN